jgi:hypothetical protein
LIFPYAKRVNQIETDSDWRKLDKSGERKRLHQNDMISILNKKKDR